MAKYIEFDKNKKLDVVILGRAGIDFNPVDINKPLENSQTFNRYLGGSAANTAVGLARLNKNIGFITKISKDQFGSFVINYFKKEGIDYTQVRDDNEHNSSLGLAITEIKAPGESSIIMYRNNASDLRLNIDEVSEDYIAQAKSLLISGTALAASPSREAALGAIEYAKKSKTKIIFDIDYRPYTWKNQKDVSIYYSIVAKNSDIIMGSLEEFELMGSLYMNKKSMDEIAEYWLQYSSILIIKTGSKGSYCYLRDGSKYSINVFPVKLLKSFGGGDAYSSSFISGLIDNIDITLNLTRASASAAMLVASHSCSDDMPTLNDINNFINEHKDQVNQIVTKIR